MKILIINENHHSCIGGIETYTKKLANLFTQLGHQVSEFAFHLNPERIGEAATNNQIINLNPLKPEQLQSRSMWQKRIAIKTGVAKILTIQDQYDLIINQSANVKWPSAIYQNPKWLYIQHFHPDFYQQKFIAGKFLAPIIRWGMQMVGIKNPFKHFQNFVCYTQADQNRFGFKNHQRCWNIPLSAFDAKEIKAIRDTKKPHLNPQLIYLGRIDPMQKQIKKMIKFAHKLNLKINFYGTGKTRLFKNSPQIYRGKLNHQDLIATLNQFKYLILFSKQEGFSFALTEALSTGLPVIINDNAASSQWLIKDRGFLIKRKSDLKQLQILINDEQLYKKMQDNCFDFALKYLTNEHWNRNWIQVLDHFASLKD